MKGIYILSKDHLSYWLRHLRKEADLVGPLATSSDDIVFNSIENIHEIKLDCPANIPSPKEFIFPQREKMFEFSGKGVKSFNSTPNRVIFGVRSCDVSAISLLDKFYGGAIEDDFYMSRRKKALFISITCNKPDPTCFCIGLGTGPFLKSGFDIQLTDLGDRYLAEAGSKQAEKIISGFRHIFSRPSKSDFEDQYEAMLNSQSSFEKRISLESVRQKIIAGRVQDSFWESVALRCFECGGCVYECPLCTCFNVLDWKIAEGKGVRMRLWDTCMFKGFTRMAGNVIPAEKKIMRTKRWYYHKLIYYPEQFGRFGCTGCGRCSITCPGRIDMAAISSRLEKAG